MDRFAEKSAHRAKNLHQAVIEAQEDIADLFRIDLPLGQFRHEHILMFELVLQNTLERFAQRLVMVGFPEGEVLSDPVDLDCF